MESARNKFIVIKYASLNKTNKRKDNVWREKLYKVNKRWMQWSVGNYIIHSGRALLHEQAIVSELRQCINSEIRLDNRVVDLK